MTAAKGDIVFWFRISLLIYSWHVSSFGSSTAYCVTLLVSTALNTTPNFIVTGGLNLIYHLALIVLNVMTIFSARQRADARYCYSNSACLSRPPSVAFRYCVKKSLR